MLSDLLPCPLASEGVSGAQLPCHHSSDFTWVAAAFVFVFLKNCALVIFFIFYIECIGMISVIKLCRVKVYNIIMHYLYIALCGPHSKSDLLGSPCIGPPCSLLPPSHPRSPLITIIVVCVYEFLFVCLIVHLLCSLLYSTYEWNHVVLDFPPDLFRLP